MINLLQRRIPTVIGESDARFPTDQDSRIAIAQAGARLDRLNDALEQVMPHAKDLSKGELRPTGAKSGGTSIGHHATVTDVDGDHVKVMVKPRYDDDQHMDLKDSFAQAIRKAAGAAYLPVALRMDPVRDLPGSPLYNNYVRGRIEGPDEAVSHDVSKLTDAEKMVVLDDFVFSLLNEDFDTGTRQYKKVLLPDGTEAMADGDRDHAQVEAHGQTGIDFPLNRFIGFNDFATAQNEVFQDYVHKPTSDIDLNIMRARVRSLQERVTPEVVEKAAKLYCKRVYGDLPKESYKAKKAEIVDNYMKRLGNLESIVERYIRVLDMEKAARAAHDLRPAEKLALGLEDARLRAQGDFGDGELMNLTFNQGLRSLREQKAEIPIYSANDSSRQVGTIQAKALFGEMDREAAAHDAQKAAEEKSKGDDKKA